MGKNIEIVTVVGANGTMGANISGFFASVGNAKVYMVCRDVLKAKAAMHRMNVKSELCRKNLIPADYTMLDSCIAQSDLVFECVAEKLNVKLDVTARIAKALRPDAVACSGTSGLSITMISECIPENLRCRYMGMHLFNPPYSMPLCELTPTKYTDEELLEEMKDYLCNALHRTVVVVKDEPAFLANRIGFRFINEAMQLAARYKHRGGIDYIDGILGPFSGREMAPLATADFVGLDVHQAIVDNLYENTDDYEHSTFALPAYVQKLIHEGKLGRKNKMGLYKMAISKDGEKTLLVYDIASDSYREGRKYSFTFACSMNRCFSVGDYMGAFKALLEDQSVEAKLCLELLLKYIVYGLAMGQKIGCDVHAADDVMATGFRWCPPLAMIDAFSSVTDFESLVKERLSVNVLNGANVDEILKSIEPSHYDYRLFFKASNR